MRNFLLLGFILLVCIQRHHGCLEEERRALLELKEFLESDGSHSDPLLPSWIYDPKSNCCLWERVTCNSTNGHVTELSLQNLKDGTFSITFDRNISLFQSFEKLRILNLSSNDLGDWNITAGYSSFSRLQWLETLDLSDNAFTNNILQSLSALRSLENLILRNNLFEGSISDQDLKDFAKLSKLKYVDLSENNFNKDIMKFLGTLPSLTSVDLSSNYMEGSLFGHDLDKLSNLEVVNLRNNQLGGTLPLKGSLKKLEIMDLTNNAFNGSIPSHIGALSSLKALSLSHNSLEGNLPMIPGLCELKTLQELDLRGNSLQGILPPCLNKLTSLKVLDVSDNLFNGTISSYLMPSLTSLEYIDLSQNSFEGILSFNSTIDHSKLKVVIIARDGYHIENNNLYIDMEDSGWNALFGLEVLGLCNCNLESIPRFLYSQHRLKAVDLSRNKLNGKFPTWLLGNNSELGVLNARNNSFDGPLSLPPYIMRNFVWLDISINHFDGQLPEDIGTIFPNLNYLNFSENSFEGYLPPSIGRMKNLWLLDLSNNNFTGEVPKELTAYCIELRFLLLSNNKFSGQIFSAHFNLSHLLDLRLDNNCFIGSLTNVNFKLFRELSTLDVSNNNMTGKIPGWIADSWMLDVVVMSNNSFEGHFPCGQDSLGYLVALDLSHNFLSGPLPSCLGPDNLELVNLEGNKFTGSIPTALFNSSSLSLLNLRNNGLSGSIPDPVGIPNIRILLLGNNNLSGLIPEQLCELKGIGLMDLSDNLFSGSIPSCFNNVTFGMRDIPVFGNRGILDLESDTISYNYGNYLLEKDVSFAISSVARLHFGIDFTTKYLLLPYKGGILDFFSGLDLSANNLIGRIPWSIGDLSSILAINLSHNHLTGSIPISFSNLSNIESLDLSYNNLSGAIPFDLTRLYSLGAFSVAHNNLSGKIPDVPQLSTFGESSYEGNPFLCGKPSTKDCSSDTEPPQSPTAESEVKWYEVDLVSFFGSFAATYIMISLSFVTILYINPYWRRRWFNFIEDFMDSCYYYVLRRIRCQIVNNFVLE